MSEIISYAMDGGSIGLHVEHPQADTAPAVVVLHEVFGINDDVRATCRELAERGYMAICPDLYWRIAPGFSLSRWTEADMPRINQLYTEFDRDLAAQDIAEVLAFSRSIQGTSGRAALLGYCMGGLMAFLTTARYGADATVVYYPGQAETYLNEADRVSTPMIVHLGEADEYILPEARRAIADAFATNPAVAVHSYPGCGHAFARHGGDRYDPAAAALANERSWTFLDTHLR